MRWLRWPGSVLAMLLPVPAHAHIGFAANNLYLGMLHPLMHLATLLPVIALSLWFSRWPRAGLAPLAAAYLASGALGAALAVQLVELPDLSGLLLPLAILIGLLVALDWVPPRRTGLVLVALAGAAIGFEGVAQVKADLIDPLLYVSGLLLVLGLVPLHLTGLLHGREHLWIRTGVRIAGSWIATAVLLVLALALVKP